MGLASYARGKVFKVLTLWVMAENTDQIAGYLPNLKEQMKMKCNEHLNNSKRKRAELRKPRVFSEAIVI